MHIGIDFGTSNTSVAVRSAGGVHLVELEDGLTSIPTAIFYEMGSRDYFIGTRALDVYEDGEDGRLMRSIKSVLGADLIDETTQLGTRSIAFRQVITDFLARLIRSVERSTGEKITSITQGRPVSFNDTDKALDQKAEDMLRSCLESAGVNDVHFLFEPVAAARSMTFPEGREKLVFVVDIGGGTSDFSVVRIPANNIGFDVLGSAGVYVGGNDFDRLLSYFELCPLFGRTETLELNGLPTPSAPYVTLSDWKSLNKLYLPAVRREIDWMRKHSPQSRGIRAFEHLVANFEAGLYAHLTEQTKIALSGADCADFTYEAGRTTISKSVQQASFIALMTDSLKAMNAAASVCLALAEVTPDQITDILMVGGSTFIPAVEQGFANRFPNAVVCSNDRFGAVALGLAKHGF